MIISHVRRFRVFVYKRRVTDRKALNLILIRRRLNKSRTHRFSAKKRSLAANSHDLNNYTASHEETTLFWDSSRTIAAR